MQKIKSLGIGTAGILGEHGLLQITPDAINNITKIISLLGQIAIAAVTIITLVKQVKKPKI